MDDKERDEKILKSIAVSYLLLRRAIGILGIIFPVVLFLGCLCFQYCDPWQSSISCYYHTVMRNVFVGVLWIFGVFLLFYRYDTADNILTTIAGICAVGISVCPTLVDECGSCGYECYRSEGVGHLHLAFAASFFLILAYISIKLFTRTNQKNPDAKKLQSNRIYRRCGWTMVACIVLIGVYIYFLEDRFPVLAKGRPVFCLETIALWAFGRSWIRKGDITLKDIIVYPAKMLAQYTRNMMNYVKGK